MSAIASHADEYGLPIAWTAELSRHSRWLQTVVRTWLRGPEGVDEVMQELALAVVSQNSRPSSHTGIAPWLYRLAVRQALLHRRKLGRRRKTLEKYQTRLASLDSDDSAQDPLQWLLAAERQQLIRRALEQMPTREAEILLLKYTEQWSYRDLADHLGISISAVEARLHRARSRLRHELTILNVIETKQ